MFERTLEYTLKYSVVVEVQKGSIMRTVATALVLIAGAAVILWYGSTLNNSWVLGGLIGGLAAILLSIPISLTLFSHLSRRHDERMERIDEQEEGRMRLAREYQYPAVPAQRYEVEGEGYTIREVDEDDYDDEDDEDDEEAMERHRPSRRLPAPQFEEQRLRQRQNMTRPMQQTMNEAIDIPAHRSQAYLPAPRQQAQQPSQLQQPQQGTAQRKDTKVLRSTSLHNMSQHRMEAMRRARREAVREAQDSVEDSPTNYSRQERAIRSQQRPRNPNQYVQETQRTRSSGALRPASNPSRSRRDGGSDTTSKIEKRQFYRSSDEEYEDTAFQAPIRQRDPETDYIDNQLSSRITPSRRTPQTEQIIRRARTKDLHLDSSSFSEEDDIPINRPLIRRAPYMYEDDELRQRLAQQIEPPTVRRSSRQEAWQEEE